MPPFAQASLAFTILLSAVGTHLALTPPHSVTSADDGSKNTPDSLLPTGDFMRQFGLTGKIGTTLGPLPLVLLALHTALLTLFYPDIPSRLLIFRSNTTTTTNTRNTANTPNTPSTTSTAGATNATSTYGAQATLENINPKLLTWSCNTAIPLSLILLFAVPLRLASYSTLGKDFTFALAEPGRLVTTGLYRYVQHPSYTALTTLVASNAALTFRTDGALGCWIPASISQSPTLKRVEKTVVAPLWLALTVYTISRRVQQEEEMMLQVFGEEWVRWHRTTARFIPWVF